MVGAVQTGREAGQKERQGHGQTEGVLSLLIEQKPFPASYNDHPLKGDWRGFRDLHIEPDWLLLNRVEGDELQLARTGTHECVGRGLPFSCRQFSQNAASCPIGRVYILRKTGIVTKGLADKSIELELSPDEVVRLALSALTLAEYLALDKVHGAYFLWSSYTEHGEALHPEAALPPIEEYRSNRSWFRLIPDAENIDVLDSATAPTVMAGLGPAITVGAVFIVGEPELMAVVITWSDYHERRQL